MSVKLKRDAFTMIELLVVVAVIGILVGIVLPSLSTAKIKARKMKTHADTKSIEMAIKNYLNEYGRYPLQDDGEESSGDITSPSGSINDKYKELMGVLLNTEDIGNVDLDEENPRRRLFLELNEQSVNEDGVLLDPWENPYQVIMDYDFNDKIEIAALATNLNRGVAVWSLGPDRVDDKGENDDITSWQ